MLFQRVQGLAVAARLMTFASAYITDPPSTAASDTAKDCSAWQMPTAADSCDSIAKAWLISTADFLAYNPSVGSGCKLILGDSYCVERNFGIPQPDPTTSSSSLSATPTTPSNGVVTPSPIQSGMVTNCNKFYWVVKDNTCYDLAAKFSINLDQFYAWNPFVENTCKKLWPKTYVCVGLTGQGSTPTPTAGSGNTMRPTSTITTPANGITTPTPVQSGTTSNCNKFYFVVKDDNCYAIAQSNSISLDQFYAWNPAVGNTCATLGLGTYVCVATVGSAPTTLKTTAKPTSATFCTKSFNLSKGQYECPTPTPTPTRAGNGIVTPTPFQAGMTTNCKKFYKVVKDDGCWAISNTFGIDLNDFYKWNPAVGSSCATLWPDNYVCVGV